jgi:hypothetical protein
VLVKIVLGLQPILTVRPIKARRNHPALKLGVVKLIRKGISAMLIGDEWLNEGARLGLVLRRLSNGNPLTSLGGRAQSSAIEKKSNEDSRKEESLEMMVRWKNNLRDAKDEGGKEWQTEKDPED